MDIVWNMKILVKYMKLLIILVLCYANMSKNNPSCHVYKKFLEPLLSSLTVNQNKYYHDPFMMY